MHTTYYILHTAYYIHIINIINIIRDNTNTNTTKHNKQLLWIFITGGCSGRGGAVDWGSIA